MVKFFYFHYRIEDNNFFFKLPNRTEPNLLTELNRNPNFSVRLIVAGLHEAISLSVEQGMSFVMFYFQGKLPGAFYRVRDIEAQRFISKCLVPASKRVSARELLQDPFLASEESWMVYARGAENLKPFLNENEMDRLKLEDDELGIGRSHMTITGKLNAEDNNTIFLNVIIADEDGKKELS